MADLHPIVIPPLAYTYKSIKFTCSGEGLYKDGYLYDPNAEKLIPPKTPKAVAGSRELEKKPVAFWKAQCAFRGLNQTGAIADLQLRLREAKKKILPELKNAETELNKEFKKKNNAARNESWKSLKTVEQKAKENPRKFLTEAFPKGTTGRPANLDIIVLKIGADDRYAVTNAAESMGLEAVSVDAPWTSNKKPFPDRWVIIGRTRDAVWNLMREIEREVERSKHEFAAEKANNPPKGSSKPDAHKTSTTTLKKEAKSTASSKPPVPKASTAPVKKDGRLNSAPKVKQESKSSPAPKARQEGQLVNPPRAVARAASPHRKDSAPKSERSTAKQTVSKNVVRDYHAPSSHKNEPLGPVVDYSWEVCGSFEITCPAIDEQWGGQGNHSMKLDLHFETKHGKRQFYGVFDFLVVAGIMRFEKPIPVSKTDNKMESSKKRKRDEPDEDGDIQMDMYPEFTGDDSGDYTEKVFFLGSSDKPTARRPIWRYRWRGLAGRGGGIQVGSDRAVRSMTFSQKGNHLSGSFKCDLLPEFYFEGVKVRSRPGNEHADPEALWVNAIEAAHEYAGGWEW
ncbi:hypothetical protein MBM_01837 [Drepanopeziza brunnea f. sp. 'multigermtubi' MB_m1]|uniref:Uncharacterized protein n=1 Tax=Marssonina brunnea f. sp. multigermtubi (strain MB_m1) TaxID=1072389 RepID=K1WQG4_MARBU|nr:uncharacterized protein MBM_01837 [Drepanopeziza brunnea f. sp. 'multigermtubi' MB_m1]EKD19885.1 hypothetical protein MBM_01837 [Drepanopeziza brunnea f. sp. 'multigermtubi' MB_m1]